ncbi:MAG: integrase core domain-containing protein [Akkermansiaceae bacterium]
MFDELEAVRDLSWEWMISYNEERPHAALNNLTPSQYSNLKLSA